MPDRNTSKIGLTDLRNAFRDELRLELSPRHSELFDWVQYLRNRIVHRGGRVSSKLVSDWKTLDASAKAIWTHAARRSPPLVVGERADLGDGEARATLAVIHRLATGINNELARIVEPDVWVRIAVDDFMATHPHVASLSLDKLRRKLLAHVKMFYGPLGLANRDLARRLRELSKPTYKSLGTR